MFTRILLALDASDSTEVAVSFTTALARQFGSAVRVVHVNQLLVGGRGYAEETEQEAMQIVDAAVGDLSAAGVTADGVHYLANCFTIDDRIAEAAQDWGADVIVFGSKRRRLPRLAGAGLRERVTAITGLPTLAAPAPLKLARRNRSRELASLPLAAVEEQAIVS
jgi:nucleotide-binding universal stress UspA family protein